MKERILFTNLLTAKQVPVVYSSWGFTKAHLPKKGKQTVLSVPQKPVLRVTKTDKKATYGGALYLCEHLEQRSPDDGTSGQDRESYSDTQDRKHYSSK